MYATDLKCVSSFELNDIDAAKQLEAEGAAIFLLLNTLFEPFPLAYGEKTNQPNYALGTIRLNGIIVL